MPTSVFFNLKEAKQQRINQAAIREFSHYPFEDVQVKRIVEDAGIARGSFYQYFDSITDLFVHVIHLARTTIISEYITPRSFDEHHDLIDMVRSYALHSLNASHSDQMEHSEYQLLQQIRNSRTAIRIFIEQFGILPQIKEEMMKQVTSSPDSEQFRNQIQYLPDIIIPTIKLTIEKLLLGQITNAQAADEIDAKLDIIAYGYKSIGKPNNQT